MARLPVALNLLSGRLTSLVVVVAGIVVSLAAFASLRRAEGRAMEADFVRRSTVVATAFQRVLDTRLSALHAMAGFYGASDEVRRDEFHIFAGAVRSNMGSIHALEWVPRVMHEQRAGFEEAARREGYARFAITERGTAGALAPASQREEYFPVHFIEPLAGNEAALGFDLGSDGARRTALARARDSGAMIATERLTLVQDPGSPAVLVFLPVYRNDRPHQTVQDRRAHLRGYQLAVFRIADLVDAAVAKMPQGEVAILLTDRTASATERILFAGGGQPSGEPSGPRFQSAMNVAGRDWLLEFRPTEAFFAGSPRSQAGIILVGGLLLSALLGALLAGAALHTQRIERSERDLAEALETTQRAQREADLLDHVMQQINVGVGLEQILDFIFDSFDAIIPYDRIGFATIGEGDRMVRSRWARSRSGKLAITTDYRTALAGSSLQAIVASGAPRIIPDLHAYLREHPESLSTRLIVEEGMRSSLTCPLIAMGRAVGFLFFSSTVPGTYAQEHVRTFTRIANQLSLAVHKARLYDEIGEELHRSQERFALAVRGTDAGIWDWDVSAGAVYFSPRWKSMLGCAEDEIDGNFEEWERRLHPEDRERALATVRDYLEGRSANYELEHRLRHKDGSYRWIIARGAAVRDAQGRPVRMVGSHIDVTGRKQAEQSLRETHAQLLAAQKIQEHLLPKSPPAIPGLDIAGACRPCNFTAGDYFDYLLMEDGGLVLVVADVMGHGFGPALLAATIHAYLRSVAGTCMGIEQMAGNLNRLLHRATEEGRFATLFLGRLDPASLRLDYINAGHPPGHIIDAGGAVKATLRSTMPPLGLEPDATFAVSGSACLEPGDLLLLITDGVYEARSREDGQFGLPRALQAVIDGRSLPADRLVADLCDAARAFAGGGELDDDLTAMVLKVAGAPVLTHLAPDRVEYAHALHEDAGPRQ